DYAPSDTESEGELQSEVDTEDEDQSISTRLQQNQQYMDQQLDAPSTWILEPQTWQTTEGTNAVLIRKPTASKMPHRLINPYIYRNIQNLGTLDDLAVLLDTPDDWEQRYNRIVTDGRIIRKLNRFISLPDDAHEADIQFSFAGLVQVIATYLDLDLQSSSETKIIVGGILARYQYDLRSKTDPHFFGINGKNLIASEAKTHRTFAPGEMWYRSSRGIQVVSALYAFNCPTFLFTQRQWKLFVENVDRNAILTFPYDDNPDYTHHINSSLVQPMGKTFLKAIVLCLLSRRDSLDQTIQELTLKECSNVIDTPKDSIIKPKYFETSDKPKTQSARFLGEPKPSYLSGYDDKGQPIYSLVRVVPQEVVARIEDEIAVQENKEYEWQPVK
ncbi:hypothetical protein O9G_005506, partial [Rozella allomycis CSF55]